MTRRLGFVVGAFGVPADHRLDGQAGAGRRQRRDSSSRRARWRPLPGCSTATGRRRTSARRTSAPRCSASSNGRSPIACGCCRAFGSTTTTRTSTSTARSTAGCRPTDPGAASRCSGRSLRRRPIKPALDDTNVSGQLTAAYRVAAQRERVRDLCDQLQVDRPEPVRRADRRRWASRRWKPPRSSPRTSATSRSA